MIKGVIFDYNSTLFFDLDLHVEAWKRLYLSLGCAEEGFEDFFKMACTVPNRVSVEWMGKETGKTFTEEEIAKHSLQKEVYYHEEVLRNKRNELAPGAIDLIEYLLNNGYKINICTASIAYNVDFYFENTKLDRWFDRDKVAFDDGICANKTEMYQAAARNIGLLPEECLIFEDSIRSIKDALNAGFDKFIYVNHYHKERPEIKEVLQEIEDFTQLDYSVFK